MDYLIVGQGLAGTLLSYYLIKHRKKVLVLNNSNSVPSSRVAAGLFSPVTGPASVATWRADELIPFAFNLYTELEELLNVKLLHKKTLVRLFSGYKDQNDWQAKSNSDPRDFFEFDNSKVNNLFGGFRVKNAGNVDLKVLLDRYKSFLEERMIYKEEIFDYSLLQYNSAGVTYKDLEADKIIFCEGYMGQCNPWFRFLPFEPNKGEVLTATCDALQIEEIISKGIFILPLGGNQYKIGSTYDRENINFEITEAARSELLEKAESIVKYPINVIIQEAGIRPSVRDRRPILGPHPENSRFNIFNGLGSKGTILAPFFANMLAAHLTEGLEIEREVHINRFMKFYNR